MRKAILILFILLGGARGGQATDRVVTFRLYRGYLIVTRCAVAGQRGLTAVIDTGTTESILDLGLVNRLSLETWADSATAVTKETVVRGVSLPDFEMGPVRVKRLDGIAMDLAELGRKLGVRVDVVIGMDVLQRENFEIDYESHVMTFGGSRTMGHGAPLAPGLRFALVDSSVLGRPMRLQVDTGFNGLLLYGKRLKGFAQTVDTGARIDGAAQGSGVRSADSPEVRVGNWQGFHITVSVVEGAPRDLEAFDGLLGPRLLGMKRLAFDFDHRMLYWD